MSFHAKDLGKSRTSQADAIYSITTVTYERQRIFSDFKSARLLIQTLQQTQHDHQAETIGFVVMPEHLHWMFSLNQNIKLSVLMMTIKGRSARNINLFRASSDPVWQSGYYDHCLRHDDDLRKNMRYLVANPLRAGITSSLKLYPHWDCIYL